MKFSSTSKYKLCWQNTWNADIKLLYLRNYKFKLGINEPLNTSAQCSNTNSNTSTPSKIKWRRYNLQSWQFRENGQCVRTVPPPNLPLLLPPELWERSRNVGEEEDEAHELRLVDGVIPKISCTVGRWYSLDTDSVNRNIQILNRSESWFLLPIATWSNKCICWILCIVRCRMKLLATYTVVVISYFGAVLNKRNDFKMERCIQQSTHKF